MADDDPFKANDYSGSGPVEYYASEPTSESTMDIALRKAESILLDVPGVTSVGIGYGQPGRQALIVGVVDSGVLMNLPTDIDGVPVIGTVTGEVKALRD